mgnify:CR=1 FL=1
MQQVKVILGRFQPFTLGHLKIATISNLNGPDKEQTEKLREQPDLESIEKQKTIILAITAMMLGTSCNGQTSKNQNNIL